MTPSEQRLADLEELKALAPHYVTITTREESGAFYRALERELPLMLECFEFVLKHGGAVKLALDDLLGSAVSLQARTLALAARNALPKLPP